MKQDNGFLGWRFQLDMPPIVSIFSYRLDFVSSGDHGSQGCAVPSLRQDLKRLFEPDEIVAALTLSAQPHASQQPFASVLLAQREVERHRVVLTLSTWNGLDVYLWSEKPKHGHDPNHGSGPGQQSIDQDSLLCLNLVQGDRGAASPQRPLRNSTLSQGSRDTLTTARKWVMVILSRQNPRPGQPTWIFCEGHERPPRRFFRARRMDARYGGAMRGPFGAAGCSSQSRFGCPRGPRHPSSTNEGSGMSPVRTHAQAVPEVPVSTPPVPSPGRRDHRSLSGRQAQRQRRDRLEAGRHFNFSKGADVLVLALAIGCLCRALAERTGNDLDESGRAERFGAGGFHRDSRRSAGVSCYNLFIH